MPVGWRRDMVPSVTNDHGLIDLTSATEDDPAVRRRGARPGEPHRRRDENGGFTSVDQLAGIKGIGQSRLELLRPQVTLPPAEPKAEERPAGGCGRALSRSPARVPARPSKTSRSTASSCPPSGRRAPAPALARRRPPAVVDAPAPGAEPERGLAAFLRDNTVNAALLGLAVAAQLLVIVLVVWVL